MKIEKIDAKIDFKILFFTKKSIFIKKFEIFHKIQFFTKNSNFHIKNQIFTKKVSNKFVYYNENMNNFKRNYLENYNDSEHIVKTKNAPSFMNFPNINK